MTFCCRSVRQLKYSPSLIWSRLQPLYILCSGECRHSFCFQSFCAFFFVLFNSFVSGVFVVPLLKKHRFAKPPASSSLETGQYFPLQTKMYPCRFHCGNTRKKSLRNLQGFPIIIPVIISESTGDRSSFCAVKFVVDHRFFRVGVNNTPLARVPVCYCDNVPCHSTSSSAIAHRSIVLHLCFIVLPAVSMETIGAYNCFSIG